MKTAPEKMNESNLRILDVETAIRTAIGQIQSSTPELTDAEINSALLKILSHDNQLQLREERNNSI